MKIILTLICTMLLLSAQEIKSEPVPNAIAVYWKTLDKKEKNDARSLIHLNALLPNI